MVRYFLMSKGNNKKKKFSKETILLIMDGVLFTILIVTVVYAFLFLVNNVLPAVTSRDEGSVSNEIHFELEKFDELRL